MYAVTTFNCSFHTEGQVTFYSRTFKHFPGHKLTQMTPSKIHSITYHFSSEGAAVPNVRTATLSRDDLGQCIESHISRVKGDRSRLPELDEVQYKILKSLELAGFYLDCLSKQFGPLPKPTDEPSGSATSFYGTSPKDADNCGCVIS